MGKKIKHTISLADVANVIDTLKTNVISDCKYLSDWLNAKGHLTSNYQELIEEARQDLAKNLSRWNEEELRMNFVSPVFKASQLNEPNKKEAAFSDILFFIILILTILVARYFICFNSSVFFAKFPFPLCYHYSRQAVTNYVYRGAPHVHESINPQNHHDRL